MSQAEHADVVIVGAGLLGLCVADALRGRRDVRVLESAMVGHARGGSHGPSRVFRLGYNDPLYVEMAQRSLPRWRALEASTGRRLLETTGQLTFGPGADAVHDALVARNAPASRLTASEVDAEFPAFAARGAAVFEPESGVIDAAATLDALRAQIEVREGVRVRGVGRGGRVETDSGAIDANVVVVCAGPWSRALVDFDLGPTFATLEHVAFFRPPPGAPPRPIFIDFDEPAIYGLPTPGSHLYKLAFHHGGARIDPDARDLVVDSREVARLEAAAMEWLPGYELVEVDVCLYDNTPNEDFVLDRVDNVVIGCGTSGHGFKFGPLLGDVLASLVETTEAPIALDRFRLGRARSDSVS